MRYIMRMSRLLQTLGFQRRKKRVKWPKASDVVVAELKAPGE